MINDLGKSKTCPSLVGNLGLLGLILNLTCFSFLLCVSYLLDPERKRCTFSKLITDSSRTPAFFMFWESRDIYIISYVWAFSSDYIFSKKIDIFPIALFGAGFCSFLPCYVCTCTARVILDRDSGRSKGFGFVSFADTDAATSALAMDGQVRIPFGCKKKWIRLVLVYFLILIMNVLCRHCKGGIFV